MLNHCHLKVVGLTCDDATQNCMLFAMHHLMNWHENSGGSGELVYKTINYCAQDHYSYFISDPPHLLNTLHNSLKSSGTNFVTYTESTQPFLYHHSILKYFKFCWDIIFFYIFGILGVQLDSEVF